MSAVVAKAPIPAGLLEQHRGKWIAVRAGEEVVAVADDLESLLQDERVETTDAVVRVPDSDALFF